VISYHEATKLIESLSINIRETLMPIKNSIGFYLSRDLFSPMDSPSFNQSAMDGYAIKFSKSKNYTVVGESKAGLAKKYNIKSGEALRVFTGAYISEDIDCVVMQEKVSLSNRTIKLNENPKKNQNIRFKGEQIKKGDLILKKGSKINLGSIGYIMSLGISDIYVSKKPSISIIITGDELVSNGKQIELGQIYESNSVMIKNCLIKEGINNLKIFKTKDNLELISKRIKKEITKSDIIILSGGISVGDYDFVRKALKQNKIKQIFYKVKQKPGKPIWFGKKNSQFAIALPGNPGSTLTCLFLYLLPLIKKIQGANSIHLNKVRLMINQDFSNHTEKQIFLKGKVSNEKVHVLSNQSSAKLSSFSICDALICIPENSNKILKNQKVDCILLPN